MSSFIPANLLADKYIGLGLAIASSLAIGTSFIITKKVWDGSHAIVLMLTLPLDSGSGESIRSRTFRTTPKHSLRV